MVEVVLRTTDCTKRYMGQSGKFCLGKQVSMKYRTYIRSWQTNSPPHLGCSVDMCVLLMRAAVGQCDQGNTGVNQIVLW